MQKWNINFELGNSLTEEQLNFFNEHGVIVFRNFISREKVEI